jgi:hypothetical protein
MSTETHPYLGMFQGGLVKERSGTAPFTARKTLPSGHMRGGGLFLSGAAWASGAFVPTTRKISPG